jgi:predicted ATPase
VQFARGTFGATRRGMTTKPFYKPPVRIVLTGGPGAGKTAILELARRDFCRHVQVLPEAASIVFGGGFPRHDRKVERRAGQRAIYYVQTELESLAMDDDELAVAMCDRGTLDGLAYWPGERADFFAELRTSMYEEMARYHAVIHLRVPNDAALYRGTALRRESHAQAQEIDDRLLEVWAKHPRRVVIDDSVDFMDKARRAFDAIRGAMVAHDCLAA